MVIFKNNTRWSTVRILLITLIIARLLFFTVKNLSYFSRRFDAEFFGRLYSESQYVKGPQSKGGIGDDGLYAFAGYYYFFQKGDVSSVNFEHPPLGKYLIGLSIYLFNNENAINLIYLSVLLAVTYKLAKIVLQDSIFPLLAVNFIVLDPLFSDHLIRSQLDLPFTLFFVSAVYFFILGIAKRHYLILAQVFWGLAFSTRFFPAIVVVEALLAIILYIYKFKYLRYFILSSPIIILIYLVSHTSFFIYHPSIIEFYRHKIWMLSWFKGTPVIAGNMLRNLITGKYMNTSGKLVFNEHWTVMIPLVVALGLTSLRRIFFLDAKFAAIYTLTLIYFIYLNIMTNGVHKFFMPIYPLITIMAVIHLKHLCSIITSCVKKNT